MGGAAAALSWVVVGRAGPVGAAVVGSTQQEQQQQIGAGPTYREKGRPALLEALVYLPKGACVCVQWGM